MQSAQPRLYVLLEEDLPKQAAVLFLNSCLWTIDNLRDDVTNQYCPAEKQLWQQDSCCPGLPLQRLAAKRTNLLPKSAPKRQPPFNCGQNRKHMRAKDVADTQHPAGTSPASTDSLDRAVSRKPSDTESMKTSCRHDCQELAAT